MSWKKPFEETWPDPVEDLRRRFGLIRPSYSLRSLLRLTAIMVAVLVVIVAVLELLGGPA